LCFFVIFRGELIDFGFLLESGMLYLKEKKKSDGGGVMRGGWGML
jgi:hypothetical protein